MANARKCDCCGVFYDAYNVKHDRFRPSGFIPINIDSDGQCFNNAGVDVCPECVKPILDIMAKVADMVGGKK